MITSFYPDDITEDKNSLRCLKMLVKEQTSISGGVKELQKQVTKAVGQIGEIVDSAKKGPSDERQQSNLAARSKKLVNVSTVWGVALPLPNELSDQQTHSWSATTSVMGDLAGSAVDGLASKLGGVKALAELASTTGFRKPLIDPGYFQDYTGTEPREFTFSWDLVPRSPSEARSIVNIIYNLKKFTLPASIGGLVLRSPYLFDLEIGNPVINRMMNMNNVVCKSMEVDYSADGSLQFLPDGTPKHMKLTMQFAERSLVTSDFY